jgi:hypothetical protein
MCTLDAVLALSTNSVSVYSEEQNRTPTVCRSAATHHGMRVERAQRTVAGQSIPTATSQQFEALVQAPGNILDRE